MRPILIVPGYRDSGPGHWQKVESGFGPWTAGERLLWELLG
jgi:predicted alpha/beta hydrolase family esterase